MRELHTIEVDRYEPSEKPGMVRHVGMISPQEAFDALEKHLKEVDLLPDEYFQSDAYAWGDIKEIPKFIRASCDVNWGGSEGIYLDIALLYRDEQGLNQRFYLATGKTLGTSGDDFLRMSRIAAECSLMLNGRGRIVRVSENEKNLDNNMDGSKLEYKVYSEEEIDGFPYQVADLVATYEELYNVPEEEKVTFYFGDYNGHFFKSERYAASLEQISDMIHRAAQSIDMTIDDFVEQKSNFAFRGEIKRLMNEKMNGSLDDKISSAAAVAEEKNGQSAECNSLNKKVEVER